jgi:hypothetical protein
MKYLKSVVFKYNSSMYILRLQRMLDEARPCTVRCQRDVEGQSKIGLNPEEISYSLDLPLSFVIAVAADVTSPKTNTYLNWV